MSPQHTTVTRWFTTAVLFVTLVASGFAIIGAPYQMQLGNPSGATSDTNNHGHYLIQRDQYAVDYNDTTHEPNWVSWDLTVADSGSAGRSAVFFQDTTLPAGFYQVLTTDYSGSGYDRGHMCPSADRTATRADNDVTFFMSNMVPQTPDNNQGVWASFETYSRTLAAAGNELLITSGTSGFAGSTIASGVAIPGYTWKIVVVVPVGTGTAVDRIIAAGASAIRVIAIKIPNIAGVRSTPWETFVTSAAQIQSDTGYTFFTALPAPIAAAFRTVIDGQSSVGTPAIVVQPVPQSVPVGGTATFTVTATGNAPLAYQWFHDDVEIPGATSDILPLNSVQAADVGSFYVVVTNDVGSTTSAAATLTVTGLPPTITTQPVSRTVSAGTNVAFTVTAGGSAPFVYQWRKGGANLGDAGNVSGSATPTLTLSNVQSGDIASYDVTITNNVSSIVSNLAALSVTPAAPTITSQPANRSLAPGSTATFSVVAVGSSPLAYQWRKGGTPVSGNASAATATLSLTGITLGDAGNYDVVVSNGVGSPATSAPASLSISSASATQIFYTGGTYVQDFDTLPNFTSPTFSFAGFGPFFAANPVASAGLNATNMGGWSFARIGGTGANATFVVGTGSGPTGAAYSFGATSATERAFGALLSGTVASTWGATFVNNTGQVISQFTLNYTGEQWRYGAGTVGGTDRISAEYLIGGSDILTGTFTPVSALNFTSPVNSATAVGTAAAVNGNLAANRGVRTATVTGITWAPGQSLVVRWRDNDVPGSDDGLAIDDFSLSTSITGPTGPSVVSSSPVNGATNAALNTAPSVTFDQAVSAAGSAFTINSAIRGAVPASLSASADGKTYTLTPPANFDFSDSISVKVFAAGVTSVSTGLHPTADFSFSFGTAAPVAPSITTQPTSQTVSAGGSASFTVGASGTAPFTYQWRKGGLAVVGNPTASSATLVLSNVQAADAASYDVVVSNGVGSPVTSAPATLTVTPTAPQIVTQPAGQTVAAGATVTLSVAATGSTPLAYQWRKGGAALANGGVVSGATTATLTLSGVTVLNSGSYDVVVSNGVGTPATSTAVSVLVIAPPSVLNYSGGTYTQNFDTLPSTGTFSFTGIGPFSLDANPGVNAAGLAGWSFVKFAPTTGNALFKPDSGGSNSGGINSYGITGTNPGTDRALGSVGSGTTASRVGVTLVNTTGQTITYVTVSYTGEQWRHGSTATPNKFAFAYAAGAVDINTGTFANFTALDFTAPNTSAANLNSPLDGNAAANRVPNITATITGLTWAPGQTLVLRWTDVDDTGSDDGIAIDDFSFTSAPPVPVITTQPLDQSVPSFSAVSFTVAAASTTPQTYQWQKDGFAILGNPSATTATLLLASATAADAGAYDCIVTNSFGPTTSTAATLATTKVATLMALDSLLATYDGTPKSATALTTPAGLSVAFTYDGSPVAPTNAGGYVVVATIEDPDYFGTAVGTLNIAKALADVTLGDLNQTYNGGARFASAGTNPGGLSVVLSYDGGLAAPVNTGSYAVDAVVNDVNYTGAASGTLTIAKALASVTLGDLNQTYDGAPKSVSAVTNPAGLAVDFTYDGSATAPTDASSYAVVGTINNANYMGTASGTLTIAKAVAPVTLTNLAQIYDGAAKPASATTSPAGLAVDFTYDGNVAAPASAGSYHVVGAINEANYTGTASGTLVIAKATASVTLSGLNQTYDGAPKPVGANTSPMGLTVDFTYNGSATAPTNADSYAVVGTVNNANYAGTASGTLVIAKAVAPVTLGGLNQIYDGAAKPVSAVTTPAGLTVDFTYNGSATAPTNADSYAVVGTVNNANYAGTASGTLVIAKAVATVTLANLAQVYDGAAKPIAVTTAPVGLNVVTTYNGTPPAPSAVGSYTVVSTVQEANYVGTASGTLVITQASATVTLSGLVQAYDGTPKPVSVVTSPANLAVTITYNGSATVPTYPGSYAVVATINETSYQGTASGTLVITTTAIVRHAPTLDGGIDGSLQVMLPENTTLNGAALLGGDLLVPGTPTVQLNGHPVYAGTVDASGSSSPSNYQVTLNGNAALRHVVRRVNAIALPVVAPPPAPAGTRDVTLNNNTQSPGNFATLRNLTLNSNVGPVVVPAGTYGTFTVNGHSGLVLGVAGATQPAVYNLQGLTLNSNSEVRIVGPVIINLPGGVTLGGSIGEADHPEWLVLNIATGGLTLNGNVTCNGYVAAPAGTVAINGNSTLNGGVISDRLTIGGNGLLKVEDPE
ncbi:MAG: MBG domain-containing protein [Lacunisphaera sp.]|nr:MBG domain-containing protein [Lacunisphaera sp.]